MNTVPRTLHQSAPVIAPEEGGSSILTLRVLYFEDLLVGLTESFSKTVSSSDVVGFAEVTGDRNPIHLSEHFAAQTALGTRIAHGLYTASLISALLGTRLPGPGAIYLSQTLNFRAPVRIGDTVLVTVTVAELLPEKSRARLTCTCRVDEDIVLDGEAVVKVPLRAKMRGQKWKRERIPGCVPGVGEADKDQEVGIKTLRSPSGGPSLAKP